MTRTECEYVRDTYPDVLDDRIPTESADRIRAHIAVCAACRAEAALLDAIHARRPHAPAGLHERIVASATWSARRPRLSRSALAMAATLTAALIGGTAIVQLRQPRPAGGAGAAGEIGFVGVDAAMLTGKTSLEDLTVEQLEALLREMES